jgi:predicted 3-demethylubiquinone-9 3-methyltransferase (glyoxalase superfamily)
MKIQNIVPCLWFERGAEETAKFYTTVFKNSKITASNPIVTTMEIGGLDLMFLNGGPHFKLNESFSLVINCENQEEIDYYWNKLTEGGQESQCGWLKDKYGVSWQVVPTVLGKLMSDPSKAPKVTEAFMKMKKFNIRELEAAAV